MFKKIAFGILIIFACIGFVLTAGFFAIKFGFTNSKGIVDNQRADFLSSDTSATSGGKETYYWQTLPEWITLKSSIVKDKAVIYRAAATAGVSPRLIVANLAVEQMRFFFDDRESYKKFFEPLKILGSQTKFSWGVMGIKEDTAIQIENHLKDKTSPYYLGSQYEHILDFPTPNTSLIDAEPPLTISEMRFTRMTDQHNHYYSYLYAGLYIKQIIAQWSASGFDISKKPDIISTLYNIGFTNSKPNANPSSGGAPIPIGDRIYSFGSLAGEFYYSNELLDEFPR